MKRKYFIEETGQEVNIGDMIQKTKVTDTTFGTVKTVEIVEITEDTLKDLIKRGVVKCKETEVSDLDNIGFYIASLAEKYNKSEKEVIDWLDKTNDICPKAVLDILLSEIAIHLFAEDMEGFTDSKEYYSLRPKDGKVGKVVNFNAFIPLFKNIEDAERARRILKTQLELMYGK